MIGMDINAICAKLGETCLQLFSIHTLNGCDKTSYHYGKGKFTLLNNLLPGTIQVWLMYQMREVSNIQKCWRQKNLSVFVKQLGQPSRTTFPYTQVMDYCWINNICTHSSVITYFSNVFSTNSNNNIADRCYVAFSFKWPARYWRVVHVEFTVFETLMSSYHKPSITFRRSISL